MDRIKKIADALLKKKTIYESAELDSVVEEAFFSFYRQQADEINRHLAYERDLRGSLNGDDSVIVKFNVNMYLDRFDKYFKKKNFYSAYMQDSYYRMLITILVPEKKISEQIPVSIRKQLFLGMIDNTVYNGKISRKLFIKYMWEYINSLEQPLNDIYPEKILEYFKDSIADEVSEKRTSSPDSEPVDIFQKLDVLTEVLVLNKIRSRKDMKKLMHSSSTLGFLLKLILLFIIALAGGFSISYFQTFIFREKLHIEMFLQVLAVFGAIWLFLLVIVITMYIYSATRKKVLFRSVSGIVKVMNIKPEVLKVFFRNKYYIDYRKIR